MSPRCRAADGWGMISGRRDLCGGARQQTDPRPLLSIQFQDSGAQRVLFKSPLCGGVNVTASVLHVHRWLKGGVHPEELHGENSGMLRKTKLYTSAWLQRSGSRFGHKCLQFTMYGSESHQYNQVKMKIKDDLHIYSRTINRRTRPVGMLKCTC